MNFRISPASCAKISASLFLSTSLILSGCSGAVISSPTSANAVSVTGNWQLNSPAATKLPALSGSLSGSSSAMTGIFHSDATSSCIAPSVPFTVSGSADANRAITLTGTSVAGGTLTLTGTLAADGKSITNATYGISGGSCAFAPATVTTATQFASITGTYNGKFYDKDSATIPVLTMTAQLTQTPASDTSGNFQLTGSANLGQNPCFTSPTAVSNTQVTGGSFTMTYADNSLGNTVTASGTFSTDGKTLTITQWTLTGSCGPDSGTGLLVQQ
jgi:hypothetical protein